MNLPALSRLLPRTRLLDLVDDCLSPQFHISYAYSDRSTDGDWLAKNRLPRVKWRCSLPIMGDGRECKLVSIPK